MVREDFKIVQKYYSTSSLIMIFYKNTIIESVEVFKNYKVIKEEVTDSKKPIKLKATKDKRTTKEIEVECEKKIKEYIINNYDFCLL